MVVWLVVVLEARYWDISCPIKCETGTKIVGT